MDVLDELAVFVVAYCDQGDAATAAAKRLGVSQILTSSEFITDDDRHNALYGFALSCGAIRAAGFNPAWIPGDAT